MTKRFPERASALAAVVLLALAAATAVAGPTPGPEDLDLVGQQIESSRLRQDELARRMEELRQEETALSARLVAFAQKVQSQEATVSAAEQRLKSLSLEEKQLNAHLASNRETVSGLLAGLQRLDMNPPPALVVETGDVLKALRSAILLGSVVPQLSGEARDLAKSLARLQNIRAETLSEREGVRSATLKLAAAREDIDKLITRKQDLLAETGRTLQSEKQRMQALAAKARTLQQLLAAIAVEKQREAERAALAAAESAAERAYQEKIRNRPKLAFADARGKLDFPAQGRLVRRFGEDDTTGSSAKGVTIATRKNAQVIAPVAGEVEFAGTFRSYGELLILDTGHGYHVLLAGMGRITVRAGQRVEAGEPLADMGETAAPAGVTTAGVQETAPLLYIEFRKNGEAVDSSPWWIGGGQEARG